MSDDTSANDLIERVVAGIHRLAELREQAEAAARQAADDADLLANWIRDNAWARVLYAPLIEPSRRLRLSSHQQYSALGRLIAALEGRGRSAAEVPGAFTVPLGKRVE